MGDENLTAEDKLRSKVSYAEGYLAATNELKKSNTPFSKFMTYSKQFLSFFTFALLIGLILFPGTLF